MRIAIIACLVVIVAVGLLVFLRRPRGVTRESTAIREKWEGELLTVPNALEVHWAAGEPVVLAGRHLVFMFKEVQVLTGWFELDVEGEDAAGGVLLTGYAVAWSRPGGRWTPTPMLIMDRESPAEALAYNQEGMFEQAEA